MTDTNYNALKELVGQPLTAMWRYAEFQRFEFGEQRPCVNRSGHPSTESDYALIVACEWALLRLDSIIVSSRDYADPESDRRDRAEWFFTRLNDDPPVVIDIEVSHSKGLRISFSDAIMLLVTPTHDSMDPEEEQWRFMFRDESRPSIVV